jgi:hypothetical protein
VSLVCKVREQGCREQGCREQVRYLNKHLKQVLKGVLLIKQVLNKHLSLLRRRLPS